MKRSQTVRKASTPLFSGRRIAALAAGLLVVAASARAGEGVALIEPWNQLVEMIYARSEIAGVTSSLQYKDPAVASKSYVVFYDSTYHQGVYDLLGEVANLMDDFLENDAPLAASSRRMVPSTFTRW